MDLKEKRIMILNDIADLYKDTEQYSVFLDLLSRNENIAPLLKGYAAAYSLMMSMMNVKWNNKCADGDYFELIDVYQKGYYLYLDFARYFLGAVVTHPTLDFVFDPMLADYSLIHNDRIDYTSFLDDIDSLKVRVKLV